MSTTTPAAYAEEFPYPAVGEDCADGARGDWVESAGIYRKDYEDGKTVNGWCEAPEDLFKLRGAAYLDDKVKVTPAACAYVTCGINILETPRRLKHAGKWCPRLASYMRAHADKYSHFFIVNWVLPGKPKRSVVHLYGRTLARGVDAAFDVAMDRYIAADAETRSQKFKYICNIVKGPWAVRMAANQMGGNRPALLGTKLTCTHYTGANYVEVAIDVGSSKVASMLSGLILSSAKSMCVDEAFLIEGQAADELPERLVGCSRFIHCALDKVSTLLELPATYCKGEDTAEGADDGEEEGPVSPTSTSSAAGQTNEEED